MNAPVRGLLDLDRVALDARSAAVLAATEKSCGGAPPWRQRKLAELLAFLRLAILSQRLRVIHADLELDLRIVFALRAPVPCAPDAEGRLRLAPHALLGLRYPETAVRLPQPGYAFVQILDPPDVFHSNVALGTQQLCLGAHLNPAIRLTELVLLTYGALTLQTISLDVLDPAGVLNPPAALFFQEHPESVPLTREPFLNLE